MKRTLWGGALLFAVTGCAVGPAYHRETLNLTPVASERRTPTVRPETPPVAFWETLGDATLQRLIDEAARSNQDVWTARARLRGARAARFAAVLDFAPTVTATASYTRQRLSSAAFPGAPGAFPEQDLWDSGLQLSWELDVFGRLRRTAQGQGALVAAAEEDVRDVQVLLAAELAGAYFDLRGAQERLAVATRNAENQRHTLEVTLQRLEAGRGNAFDSERAQAQLSSTLAGIPTLEAAIAAAQHRISVLVARPPAALAQELAAGAPLPALPETVTVSSLDSTVRLRPDVRSAERQVAAGTAFVGAAQAAYLPQVTLGGAFGYASNTFEALGNVGRPRYAIGPVVSWPALNLGRVKAGVDAARAREAEATARYHQTRLRAVAEVETSLVTYHKARQSLQHLEAAAAASERAASLARLRFAEGATDFLQVLDAERTTLDAQDRLAAGRTAATTGLVLVYRALGGSVHLPE
jgi:NodT family efflux transporter outer membrane factor (OMF) lipoprotein